MVVETRRRAAASRASRGASDAGLRRLAWTSSSGPAVDRLYFTADDGRLAADLHRAADAVEVGSTAMPLATAMNVAVDAATTAASSPSPARRWTGRPRSSSASDPGRAASPVNVSEANDELLAEARPAAARKREGQGRGRRHADVDSQAARLRPEEEMAARLPRPRRPAGRLGGRLELPLEPRSCGRRRATSSPCRIRAARPASARSSSTRSAATGAASATTTSWPASITWRSSPTSTRTAWPRPGASFGGYMMNWFAGNTDEVQDAHHPLRRLQLRQHVRHHRRDLVRRVGARRPALGQEPRSPTRSTRRTASPTSSRRRCSSSTTTSISACRSARGSSCSRRCSG